MGKWLDDEGEQHKFVIPNSYYIPAGNCKLLSPQHWAKAIGGKVGQGKVLSDVDTEEITSANSCTLFWGKGRKYQLTIPLGRRDNVATFYLAPGYASFDTFCKECKIEDAHGSLIMLPTGIVSDDEADDDDNDVIPPTQPSKSLWERLIGRDTTNDDADPEDAAPRPTTFDLDGPKVETPAVIEEEKEKKTEPTQEELQQELMRYHHRFNHASFAKLRCMAKQGIIIPSRLA